MPVVNVPVSVSKPKPIIPRVEGPDAQSNLVDTKYVPMTSLVTFIEGSSYTVNYYSQVLGQDTALYSHDAGQSRLYEQYKKINQLEIKLDGPLSVNQDDDSKRFTVTGSGTIHSLVIPNHGDMMVADAGDGREAIFQVDLSEKKSIFNESVYAITFTMLCFVKDNPAKMQDMEAKVVQELHYVHDFARQGQNPLIATSELDSLRKLNTLRTDLIDEYFKMFFSREYSTVIVPGQLDAVYDSYIPTVMTKIITTVESHWIVKTRHLNVHDDDAIKLNNLWTLLLTRNKHQERFMIKRMGLVSTRNFSYNPMLDGIRFSGIQKLVYPDVVNAPIDATHNLLSKTLLDEKLTNVPSMYGDLAGIADANDTTQTKIPFIHNVLVDDYYILSKAFYEDVGQKSRLEILVRDYIDGKSLNPTEVLAVADTYTVWGGLERFYFIPILLILMKEAISQL